MQNRWDVWMLTGYEYKAGPAASGVEWTGNLSVFTDHFAISSSLNYFSSLGKTLSITVRLGKDKREKKTLYERISCLPAPLMYWSNKTQNCTHTIPLPVFSKFLKFDLFSLVIFVVNDHWKTISRPSRFHRYIFQFRNNCSQTSEVTFSFKRKKRQIRTKKIIFLSLTRALIIHKWVICACLFLYNFIEMNK